MTEALALADSQPLQEKCRLVRWSWWLDKIVGRGMNRVIRDGDTTAHAEIVTLREALPPDQ